MLKKIFILIFLVSFSCKSYILKVQNYNTKQESFYDVGAKDRITGQEIKRLLTSEMPGISLIVYRPDDYEAQTKDRLLKDTDVLHVIDQTSKKPILYRTK